MNLSKLLLIIASVPSIPNLGYAQQSSLLPVSRTPSCDELSAWVNNDLRRFSPNGMPMARWDAEHQVYGDKPSNLSLARLDEDIKAINQCIDYIRSHKNPLDHTGHADTTIARLQNEENKFTYLKGEAQRREAQAESQRKYAEEQKEAQEHKKAAAEEAKKVAAAEAAKKAIENAIQEREAEEKRIIEERNAAVEKAAKRAKEIASLPLTIDTITNNVKQVEKFIADYDARVVNSSNVDDRLGKATRAATEASGLLQQVKAGISSEDDAATRKLEAQAIAVESHLADLMTRINKIPQEIVTEKAAEEKAAQLKQVAEQEAANKAADAKETGTRHLAVTTLNGVIAILNDGEAPVTFTDIQINDRPECAANVLEPNHTVWFNGSGGDEEKMHPITLKVGERHRWMSSCEVIFADITTYQGTSRYKFTQ
jgi:hypothetical protein